MGNFGSAIGDAGSSLGAALGGIDFDVPDMGCFDGDCTGGVALVCGDGIGDMVEGRGLHSFTFQLNLIYFFTVSMDTSYNEWTSVSPGWPFWSLYQLIHPVRVQSAQVEPNSGRV
jgi:hypothetical protein